MTLKTLVEMLHYIIMVGGLINVKNKRHLLLLTLTVQIWKVKSVSIWSSWSQFVIQLRVTSQMMWCWWGKQQPLVPSLTFLCAELLTQKASLIKSARSTTTVAIRRLFVCRLCLWSHSSRHAVRGVVGHIFTLSSRKKTVPPHHNESECSCLFNVWFFVREHSLHLELSC